MNNYSFVIRIDHPALAGHFTGNPVVPGVVVLDQVLIGLKMTSSHQSLSINQVKFLSLLYPEEIAEVEYRIQEKKYAFKVFTSRFEREVNIASGTLMLTQD